MFSRMFQFFYCIRSVIHRQARTSLYLYYISSMYFEAIFSFYIFLYHFVCNSLFRLVRLGSFSDIIKRNFSLTLAKLNFYVDMSVWLFVGKQYYRLHMHAHRELIHSPDPFQFIPVPAQYFQVPCQCRGIAADIYHFLRRHLDDCIQQDFIAAFARRIYHDHICPRRLAAVFPGVFFVISGQHFLRLSHKELRILNSVYLCILPRVLDRLRYDLHSVHFPGTLSQK